MRLVLAITVAVPSFAGAQIRSSERGVAAQTVDGTVITVDYARPQARGRRVLFGERGKAVVYWGEMWTPGANWATTLEVNREIHLNGQPVPAGKYSVWIVPQADGPWTFHLNKEPRLFHTRHPKPEDQFLTLRVTPGRTDHVEVLTFDFPRIVQDGATLRLRWGRTAVAVEVAVRPSRPAAGGGVAADATAPYVGSYTATFAGDTAPQKVEVVSAGGVLRAIFEGAFTLELIPTEELHHFTPAFLDKGKVVDVADDAAWYFELDATRATAFRVTGVEGEWIKGKRRI
jgi:DUF2911 family protein